MCACDVRNREFEIPSGFEPVKGSSAITREAVLSEDKELWFFKLPKHVRHCVLCTAWLDPLFALRLFCGQSVLIMNVLCMLNAQLDASALANVSFKVGKSSELGEAVASVTRDGKKFQLQHEDALLTQQIVNAFPLSSDRKKFSLAKPFSRVFSLVEDRTSPVVATKSSKREAPVEEDAEPAGEATKSSKKSKKSKDGDDEREKAKASKKAKAKK